jgi:molybdopterin synthase sulfur carrier subunit
MKIRYFAWLRERTGVGEEELTPPSDIRTVAQLVVWLRQRGPGHEAAFGATRLVRCAIDQEFVTPEAPIEGASEVAFFPPVTGG